MTHQLCVASLAPLTQNGMKQHPKSHPIKHKAKQKTHVATPALYVTRLIIAALQFGHAKKTQV